MISKFGLIGFLFSLCVFTHVFSSDAYKSSYTNPKSTATLIKHANIYDGNGNYFEGYDVYLKYGKIQALGKNLKPKGSFKTIKAENQFVTPGIIDIHSHMGVYSAPHLSSTSDGNEATHPNRADVWAEHSLHLRDPQFKLALAGGVTTFHVLPGSANLFGGRGVSLRNIASTTINDMKFPYAKHTLKMACGENPKRVYGKGRKRSPATRMGNIADVRTEWIKAKQYQLKTKKNKSIAKKNLKMDTLVGVLDHDILIQNHCYTSEEMGTMIAISKEFGYKITAFHHAIEAYKIADLLAKENICAAMWADWWGFKYEAMDMIPENIAIVDQAYNKKGCAIVHSDSAIGIQVLNQEMAKAWSAGNRAGFDISKARAISWITKNPAKALGILDQVGTLEKNKRADIVIWSADPFSVYAKAQFVFIDGWLAYEKDNVKNQPKSDFDLGIMSEGNDRK